MTQMRASRLAQEARPPTSASAGSDDNALTRHIKIGKCPTVELHHVSMRRLLLARAGERTGFHRITI